MITETACAITGVPLRVRDPVVSLLLTGRSGPLAAGREGTPCDVWGPRTVPVTGRMTSMCQIRYDESADVLHELWREGIRIDMVERPATDTESALNRKHYSLGDYDRVRVRPLGASSKPPRGMPTVTRVQRVFRARGLPRATVTAPAWPFVFVALTLPTNSDAQAWIRQVTLAADDNCWAVTHKVVNGSRALVHLAPGNLQEAAMVRAHTPRRPSHPLARAVVHRDVWDKACEMSGAREFTEMVAKLDLSDTGPFATGPLEARRSVRRALTLLSRFDRSRDVYMHELLEELASPAPGTVGLLWMLGRSLERAASHPVVSRGIGELVAVTETLRNAGLAWAPSRYIDTGSDPHWDVTRGLFQTTQSIVARLTE